LSKGRSSALITGNHGATVSTGMTFFWCGGAGAAWSSYRKKGGASGRHPPSPSSGRAHEGGGRRSGGVGRGGGGLGGAKPPPKKGGGGGGGGRGPSAPPGFEDRRLLVHFAVAATTSTTATRDIATCGLRPPAHCGWHRGPRGVVFSFSVLTIFHCLGAGAPTGKKKSVLSGWLKSEMNCLRTYTRGRRVAGGIAPRGARRQ